jgi:2Fe-2S ferredoxin
MIDPAWVEVAGAAGAEEAEMLEMIDSRSETSRLSCQVKVTAAMEGMVVHLPESQY